MLIINRNYTDTFAQRAASHMCLTATDSVYTNSLPVQACERLRSQVFFPSCWDGLNLDSSDHKSHVLRHSLVWNQINN
jgi:hypothetical protein